VDDVAVNLYTIPLTAAAQTLTIALGGVTYNLTVLYRSAPQGGWFLDIADQNDVPIVRGVPLVAGADLLAQYGYLQFGGKLGVYNVSAPNDPPTYANLGTDCLLYWITP
jgi:hypothetical protein